MKKENADFGNTKKKTRNDFALLKKMQPKLNY